MLTYLGMAMVAGGAWSQAFQTDEPAWIGRALVIAGAILVLLGVNMSLRRSGGERMDRGGGLWWLGVSVLTSCVALMGLVYVTMTTEFGEIQQSLVSWLLMALAVAETIRLLLSIIARLRR